MYLWRKKRCSLPTAVIFSANGIISEPYHYDKYTCARVSMQEMYLVAESDVANNCWQMDWASKTGWPNMTWYVCVWACRVPDLRPILSYTRVYVCIIIIIFYINMIIIVTIVILVLCKHFSRVSQRFFNFFFLLLLGCYSCLLFTGAFHSHVYIFAYSWIETAHFFS